MGLTATMAKAAGSGLTPGMKRALKQVRFELQANRIAARAKPAFARLRGRRHLKLHFGAGDDMRQGWVNLDLKLRMPPEIDPAKLPDTVFINHDLRRGLPLDDGSCDLIYSSHFFEHLSFADGLALMREAHRVLAEGGRFRMALPALDDLFRAYLDGDRAYFDLLDLGGLFPDEPAGTLTFVDFVNYGAYQFGEHVAIYDVDKAVALLRAAGFRTAAGSEFDPELDVPHELRRRYSFYVEATK